MGCFTFFWLMVGQEFFSFSLLVWPKTKEGVWGLLRWVYLELLQLLSLFSETMGGN